MQYHHIIGYHCMDATQRLTYAPWKRMRTRHYRQLHNNEVISTLQTMLIEKHVDYSQSYALGRQNLKAGLVVLKEQFRTCRIHLSDAIAITWSDDLSRTELHVYLFIYLFFKPKNLPRQLPGLPAGLRRPCGPHVVAGSFESQNDFGILWNCRVTTCVITLCKYRRGGGCLWCMHRGGARRVITCRVGIYILVLWHAGIDICSSTHWPTLHHRAD